MKQMPHPEEHRRMMLFVACAALIMLLSWVFITKPNMERAKLEAAKQNAVPAVTATELVVAKDDAIVSLPDALAGNARLPVETPKLVGTMNTTGLRFDDFLLKDYYTTLENNELVRLLAPSNTKGSNFVEVGFIAEGNIAVPTNATSWKIVSGDKITPATPMILQWDNGQGLVFRRTISIDQRYVVTVAQTVENKGSAPVKLYPYALISEAHHIPAKGEKVPFDKQASAVQHTGPLAYLDGELEEKSYEDMRDDKNFEYKNVKGWLGMTSKYWLVALLPKDGEIFDARFAWQKGDQEQDIFQVDYRGQPVTVAPGASEKTEMNFFAGAKKLSVLTDYEDQLNIPKLDLAVDFGVLYFLTKPIYHVLSYMGNYMHEEMHLTVSFGVALLLLTVLMRLLTFPLQNKAYRSMNAMKDLAPKLQELKEKHGKDKAVFQQEVMALYKREKVNPASGCLPILIQIPIFFALYKVIFITLDMRHAPFWGWIHDLSAPDPSNIFNLFGLLPFTPPAFLALGAWPLLYGITMYIQQSLNPKPEDPTQQQVFAFLPWVFTFVFAQFPAGLVIYYTWSNLLGIVQQYSLRRLHGHPVKQPRKSKKKKKHDGSSNS